MKKMSIAQLFGARSAGDEKPAEGASSAAERLGRALLDTLGAADDGVTEEELVEAILGEWSGAEHGGAENYPDEHGELHDGTADEPDDEEEEDPAGDEGREPFEPRAKRPAPIRTGSAASDPVDYSDMTSAQFRELRKLLKKAAAEGKRIKL